MSVDPRGVWDSDEVEIVAWISRNGEVISTNPMAYAGDPSEFAASVSLDAPGHYELQVCAYQAATGNGGFSATSLVVER